MLSHQDVEYFWEHGYLRIPNVFSASEIDAMSGEMDRLIR